MAKASKEVEKILQDIRKIKKTAPSVKRIVLLSRDFDILYEYYCNRLRIKNANNVGTFNLEDIDICRQSKT